MDKKDTTICVASLLFGALLGYIYATLTEE